MKTVVVRPERCVGCFQCRFACAVAHSFSTSAFAAPYERVLSKPRIHIGLSARKEPFPKKCRHCEPAPCETSCPTKAIHRALAEGVVLVAEDKCIRCGACGVACPFGVIRYHRYPSNRVAAHKCDQCLSRLREGRIPACVETCKSGALIFGEVNEIMDWEGSRLATSVYAAMGETEPERGAYESLRDYTYQLEQLKRG